MLLSYPTALGAQTMDSWFGSGSAYPRRPIAVHRHALARRARGTDDAGSTQQKKATGADNKPSGPLFAVLSLSEQRISVYNSSGLVTRSRVSTGMPGHRTPVGIFTIIGRERYHHSNIYSGAPMPFMQRITWSGIAMHLGVVPGYPASHGCIRLPSGSAERLWGLTKIGERVIISPNEIAPAAFAHPLLPAPKMQPSPVPLETAAKVTEVAAADNATTLSVPPKLLNPVEYAQALKARAASDIAAANKALQELSQHKELNSEPIRRALAELRAAEALRAQSQVKLNARTEALATARDARPIQRAQTALAAAETQLTESTNKVEAALQNPAFSSPEGQEALATERRLAELRQAMAKAQLLAKQAERRLAPVSILVSRKDNKVYIRQAFAPVLEAPVTIRDPATPLGTHVFIATSSDGASLGWSVVSLPSSRSVEEKSSRRPRESAVAARSESEQDTALKAANALERLELPAEVSARISELVWTGSSLIISDHPLSDETSDIGTDLVVTAR
ncbi:MAG: L,D-transpeptidase [Hyphomicrobiaceae bacterium]|nr:L,D-transpeptidase [Hyphomicrobiaceae bacterium]